LRSRLCHSGQEFACAGFAITLVSAAIAFGRGDAQSQRVVIVKIKRFALFGGLVLL
jgi:hypothetical protein